MKKVAFLLICLSLVSLSYGQSLVMHSTISTDKNNVVDKFTAYDPAVIQNTAYIGAITKTRNVNRPFQKQKFSVTSIGNSGDTGTLNMSTGRDFVVEGIYAFPSASIYGGSLFSSVTTSTAQPISSLIAGKARAQIINSTSTAITLSTASVENSSLGGRNIYINNKQIRSPLDYGSLINRTNSINKNSALATGGGDFRAHIYYPWTGSYTTVSSITPVVSGDYSNLCNGSDSLSYTPCSHTSCSYCSSNTAGKCHDVRSVTLPAVFKSNGATYNKVGSIKFYCRYNGNTCAQYADAKVGINTYEGYTGSTVPTGSLFNTATNSNIATFNIPAEKCRVVCNGACTSAGNYYVAIDTNNGDIVNIGAQYVDTARCVNANTNWPGLECQANEIDLEIYQLSCYAGSGDILREGGTFYQYRNVDCNGSGVSSESPVDSSIDTYSFITADFPKN